MTRPPLIVAFSDTVATKVGIHGLVHRRGRRGTQSWSALLRRESPRSLRSLRFKVSAEIQPLLMLQSPFSTELHHQNKRSASNARRCRKTRTTALQGHPARPTAVIRPPRRAVVQPGFGRFSGKASWHGPVSQAISPTRRFRQLHELHGILSIFRKSRSRGLVRTWPTPCRKVDLSIFPQSFAFAEHVPGFDHRQATRAV